MPNKILVTYASRLGSTAGVAEAIGKTLAEKGLEVEVRRMEDVQDLSGYDAVVAGSAIRHNQWLPEAMQFVQQHQAELKQKPFAAFTVCITLAMRNGEKYRAGVEQWFEPVRRLVTPVSAGFFAGKLDFSNVPFTFDTLFMRLAGVVGIFPKGDHRDWKAIATWANEASSRLVHSL